MIVMHRCIVCHGRRDMPGSLRRYLPAQPDDERLTHLGAQNTTHIPAYVARPDSTSDATEAVAQKGSGAAARCTPLRQYHPCSVTRRGWDANLRSTRLSLCSLYNRTVFHAPNMPLVRLSRPGYQISRVASAKRPRGSSSAPSPSPALPQRRGTNESTTCKIRFHILSLLIFLNVYLD